MKNGSSGSSTQTQQVNSTSGPPQWAQQAGKDLLAESYGVARDLKPAAIAGIAGLTPGQQNLIQSLLGNVGSTNPAFNGAQNTLAGLQGYNPQNVQAGQLAGTDLRPYMNPFTSQVIDTSLAQGRQELARTQNNTSDAAMSAGAFGGSRHGVQSGVADAQHSLGAANLAAQLNSANFAQAQGAAGQDIAARFQGDLANQAAGLQGAGLNLNAALGSGNVAGQQQAAYLQSVLAGLAGQQQLQGQQQAVNQYDADVANAANVLPMQQLQTIQGVLGGIPLAQTTNGTTTSTQQQGGGSGLLQALGGGLGLAHGLLSPLSSGGGFGSSLLGGLFGLFSDRRVKNDHGVVGKSHGVKVHEWEYKNGDGQRFRGPMADDLQRSKFADAVSVDPRTGLKVVDQRRVPNGLTVESVNPKWRKRRRKAGR